MGKLLALLWILFLSAVSVARAQELTVPVELTSEERAWLDQNPDKLVLYFNLGFPPVEFSSPSGTFKGLGADMTALIEKRLGVSFQRRPSENWDQSLAALESGECALVPTIVRTPERERFASFTPPYVTVPVVIIATRAIENGTTLNDLTGLRVAVVAGFAADGHVRRHATGRFEVVPVPDARQGLRAVSFGQVDAFVENLGIAGYHIEKEGLVNLRVVGDIDLEYALSMGVSRKYPLLSSAVQKAFAAISDPELEKIRKRWITPNADNGMSPETRRLLMLAAAFTMLLLLGLAGITYFLKRRLDEKMASLKRAQQELNVQNERLALAMDATKAGVWDYDPATDRLYLSAQLYTMLGYESGPATSTLSQWTTYVYREDLPPLEQTIRDYLAGGGRGEFEIEFRLRKADGAWCWLLVKGRGVTWDAEGRPTRIIGLNLNIQSIKEVQEKLAQSEAKFRAIFDNAPYAIVINSVEDGRYLEANKAFLEASGIGREELPTLPSEEVTKYSAAEAKAHMDRLLKTGCIKNAEIVVHRKDGSERQVIFSSTLLELQGHKQILSMTVDVTERNRAEKALKESETRFRSLFEMAPIALAEVSLEGNILQVNDCYSKLLGYTIEDGPTLAQCWKLSFPDAAYRESAMSTWRKSLDQARKDNAIVIPSNEYLVTCKDGLARTLLIGASLIGESLLVSFQDLTERRRAEGERQKLQAQLLQAQKLEAVGILAGGVAHDFNNMLGAIIGYTELSMAGIDADNPLRENLGKVLDAAQRSTNLTRQLLAFARKQTVAPMMLDLNEAVAGMLKMLRRLIGENIHLAWRPGPSGCTVKLDPSQLDQILANLCVNARDAIADVGQITIRSDTVRFDETDCQPYPDCVPGDYVLLAVSDDGRGMDNETLTHVFEPFFTTKGAGRGTGLGMATVYGIVQQNHGFIHIYSEPGMGTTINIYIPRHAASVDEAPQAAVNEVVPLSRGESLLLVEDDPTLRQMGEMMLRHLGYGVLSAATPTEAIALAGQSDTKFQIFLTDVVMPEMNGRELADRIRALRPSVKHLFMSGYTSDIITHRGVLDEGVNFIQKPFSLKDLALKLRAVLDKA